MPRPVNKQTTKSFEITVPTKLYEYLSFLAANTILGANESAVASYLLTVQLEDRLKSGFHTINTPKA